MFIYNNPCLRLHFNFKDLPCKYWHFDWKGRDGEKSKSGFGWNKRAQCKTWQTWRDYWSKISSGSTLKSQMLELHFSPDLCEILMFRSEYQRGFTDILKPGPIYPIELFFRVKSFPSFDFAQSSVVFALTCHKACNKVMYRLYIST